MEKLFNEFPPISTNEWENKIKTDLKGAPYNKLIWKTLNNFNLKPYYRNEHLNNLSHLTDTAPGEFPYYRGNSINYNWFINEQVSCKNFTEANKKAIKLINNGVNSITFYDIKNTDFNTLLNKIDLSKIEINFKIKNSHQIIVILKSLKEQNITNIKGSFFCDNLTAILFSDKQFTNEAKSNLINAQNIITNNFPNFRLIAINGINYTDAGTSATQELAFSLSTAVEYLNFFTDNNIQANDIVRLIQFNIGISSDYFIEIAKIKTLRYLWAKICEAYKIDKKNAKTHIYTQTTSFNKTIYDKHVNILRSTTEAMSAIIGGTDSLHIINFDNYLPDNYDFAQRIAKNIQIILKEEANFGKITDPAAGSYYIENISDNLINSVWELFNNIEKQGGFLSAIKNNFIKTQIEDIQKIRKQNVETRKEIILGTNQYPNLNEKIENPENIKTTKTNGKIKTFRKAEDIEQIRIKTEEAAKTPKIFLFTYGNPAMRKARAMFVANFFGVAGFDIIDNAGFNEIQQGITKFNNSKADLLVICSSDEEYLSLANEISKKITPNKIIIAGYPKEIITELNNIGISNFIHVKSNLVNELTKYQNQILNL